MKAKELLGKEVSDVNAKKIGKVVDIDFDMQRGVIDYLVVKVGLTKKYTITLHEIDKIGDEVILKISEDELRKKA